MYKKLHETEGRRNENQVYLIKQVLNEMKKVIKNVHEKKKKTFKKKKILLNVFFTLTNYINQDKA